MGSSASTQPGLPARARAIATRWRSPWPAALSGAFFFSTDTAPAASTNSMRYSVAFWMVVEVSWP